MGRNLLIQLKKSDAAKTVPERAIQKTEEKTGDLIGNKIADKITSISKNSAKKLPIIEYDTELSIHKKRCM